MKKPEFIKEKDLYGANAYLVEDGRIAITQPFCVKNKQNLIVLDRVQIQLLQEFLQECSNV